MKIVRESIEFERGKSEKGIKRTLRGDRFMPGEIVVRDRVSGLSINPHIKQLYVYVQHNPEGFLAPHKVYSFGAIDRKDGDANFIHDTQNKTGQGSIQNDTFRQANSEEAAEIQKQLDSGKYDRYIEEAKKKTGLTPFV